jgi:hypothetical protein
VKRKKQARKQSLLALNNKLWDLFSRYIRCKDADENGLVKCFTCGSVKSWKELDAGHYIAKSISLSLRFDERNVHPQCTGCNRFRHGNLTQYALALKKVYGPDILEELDEFKAKNRNIKLYPSDYVLMIDLYREKLSGLSI